MRRIHQEDTAYPCLHFTNNHEGLETQYAVSRKDQYAVSEIEYVNILDDIKHGPYSKKSPIRRDDEVIFDMDQSIKRSPAKDDECYGVDDLDDAINAEAQELLANDTTNSFLLKGLEKSIEQSNLESCECEAANDSDSIRRIKPVNTSYPVAQKTTKHNTVEREQLYSTSANKIDEKKPELKILPQHLEYAYLHGDKSFPIIILSKLSKKEKMLLLQVLEKHKGAITWKMSDIKEISPSYCTHKILMEDDYKPVIQPQSLWVNPIHVVPKKGGMTVVLNDNNELIASRTVTGWRVILLNPDRIRRSREDNIHGMKRIYKKRTKTKPNRQKRAQEWKEREEKSKSKPKSKSQIQQKSTPRSQSQSQ
ncbi:hypothetical protein Tco_0339907 [Tanacetum coccineum]